VEPSTHAQRFAVALGPAHLLLRLRTSDEDPTEAQARWRIIWKRRCAALGLLGFTTQRRVGTPLPTRLSVQVIMEVFQLLDNHSLLGHYRVKMALDSLGDRHGPTTVGQLVALYQQAHPPGPRPARLPHPDERPRHATAPPQVWCADLRDRVKRHLATLIEKGHIKPLEEFPPFRNHRPQVYRVMLPREILRQKIDEIKEQDRREAMLQAMVEFRKKFGDF
jgi:hypothetical protein